MDPWQADVLEDGMGVTKDGKWAAFEVGVNAPRQNGKDETLYARVLTGLFRLGERLVLWSSQQQDTSMEAFYRIIALIEENDEFQAQVDKVRYANGSEGIWLKNGHRIRFMTRSKSRARGFGADLIVFNEAMFLAEYSVGAMLPTLSARPNPQVWYAGSAVDQEIHDQGVVWARVRERGMAGAPKLAYTEFSVDAPGPLSLTEEQLRDEELWARANPALDVRITRDYVESEVYALDSRSFAVERLGVGDWPRTDHVSQTVIPIEAWMALKDDKSELRDPVCFGYDVSPDRRGSIAAAGRNHDGDWHVEIIESRQGTNWLIPRLVELEREHDPDMIIRDGYGPVDSLRAQEEEHDLKPTTTTAAEHAAACGNLVDAVEEKTLRHLGSTELADAIRGSATRPLGDAWAWSRKNSGVDISPLVAATLALKAAMDEQDGEFRIY